MPSTTSRSPPRNTSPPHSRHATPPSRRTRPRHAPPPRPVARERSRRQRDDNRCRRDESGLMALGIPQLCHAGRGGGRPGTADPTTSRGAGWVPPRPGGCCVHHVPISVLPAGPSRMSGRVWRRPGIFVDSTLGSCPVAGLPAPRCVGRARASPTGADERRPLPRGPRHDPWTCSPQDHPGAAHRRPHPEPLTGGTTPEPPTGGPAGPARPGRSTARSAHPGGPVTRPAAPQPACSARLPPTAKEPAP